MKFESKLNNLHSMFRDLEAKYHRSLEEINELQEQNEMYKGENKY